MKIIKPEYCQWFYSWHSFWENIRETIRWVKRIFVRGLQGWCHEDLWAFSSYLNHVIRGGLTELKEIQHGYPGTLTVEKWDRVLDEIIEGFGVEEELGEMLPKDEGYREKKEKFDKAMRLFHRWYHHFWD